MESIHNSLFEKLQRRGYKFIHLYETIQHIETQDPKVNNKLMRIE